MLRIDVALSDGQGPVNEDAIGHHGNAAWVIDGATGIGPSILDAPSDAAWLAQTANRLLAEALAVRVVELAPHGMRPDDGQRLDADQF